MHHPQAIPNRFRLAPDGLTVKEHFTDHNIEDNTFHDGETEVFTFSADVTPEGRAGVLRWLNRGWEFPEPLGAHHREGAAP